MGRVACIGVGTVGRAWAVTFARAGHEVMLFDAEPGRAEAAIGPIRTTLNQLREAGWISVPTETILSLIAPASTLAQSVAGAEYVQESVREDLDLKRSVFAELAAHASEEAILASSTSALRGSEFLGEIAYPGRALVAHPVNPPSLIPLVELCASDWTSPEVLVQTRIFLEGCSMAPVTLRHEIDGFLLNRLQYTLVAEAMHLVGEGYCSAADIDRVMTDGLALRWLTIGPFMTAHLNAAEGFKGFVDQLGPMMRRMGKEARTDYPWTEAQVQAIHNEMASEVPVARIPEQQTWRDARILAARRLQES